MTIYVKVDAITSGVIDTYTDSQYISGVTEWLELQTEFEFNPPVSAIEWRWGGGDNWYIPLDSYKAGKISLIKAQAEQTIVDRYPAWKQRNLTTDDDYAKVTIATITGLTMDQIYLNIANRITTNNVDELVSIQDNPSIIDISDLLVGIPEPYISTVTRRYQDIIVSTVAYLLIKSVRLWSNAMEDMVNNAVTKEEIDSIDLDTCPEI